MHTRMRIIIGCLTLMSLLTSGSAVDADTGTGKGKDSKSATVRVVNQTDEAITCILLPGTAVLLEPLESTDHNVLFSSKEGQPTVKAFLESDESVWTQTAVTVKNHAFTTATATSSVVGSDVQLQITFDGSGNGHSKKK